MSISMLYARCHNAYFSAASIQVVWPGSHGGVGANSFGCCGLGRRYDEDAKPLRWTRQVIAWTLLFSSPPESADFLGD
jgi:hypothetical protein